MQQNIISIAIDGPSSAGKSTIARAVADALHILYIDTGAMYRAVALKLHNLDIASDDARISDILHDTHIVLQGDSRTVLLDGQDVTAEIRSPIITELTSRVSANPAVREHLVALQRGMSERRGVVLDGRDIGSHVLPHATVKLYITATAQCRAKRRYDELIACGRQVEYDDIERAIIERDHRDTSRAVTPLVKAADAIELDTSSLTLDQAIQSALTIIRQTIGSELT